MIIAQGYPVLPAYPPLFSKSQENPPQKIKEKLKVRAKGIQSIFGSLKNSKTLKVYIQQKRVECLCRLLLKATRTKRPSFYCWEARRTPKQDKSFVFCHRNCQTFYLTWSYSDYIIFHSYILFTRFSFSHFDGQGCSIWPWGRPAFVQLYSDIDTEKKKEKRETPYFFAAKIHNIYKFLIIITHYHYNLIIMILLEVLNPNS